MNRWRGQASVEYLIVVGIAFLFMIPATYFFFNFSRESGQEISTSQLDAAGREIIQTAESLFYSGEGSKITMKLSIPEGVQAAYLVDQRELMFNTSTPTGYSELVFFSRVNLTNSQQTCHLGACAIPELAIAGAKQIQLQALDTQVSIQQVG